MRFFEGSLLRFWGWSRFSYLLFVDIGNCLRLIADKFTLGWFSFFWIFWILFSILRILKCITFFVYLACRVFFFFSSTDYSFSATLADNLTVFVYNSINMSFFERSLLRFWGWSWCFFLNYFFINVSNFLSFISYKFSFSRITFVWIARIFFRVLSFNKFKSFFIYFTSSVFIALITRNFFFNSISAYNFAIFIFSDIDVSFFEITFFQNWCRSRFFFLNYFFIDVSNSLVFAFFELTFSCCSVFFRISRVFFRIFCFFKCKSVFIYFSSSIFFRAFSSLWFFCNYFFTYYISFIIFSYIDMSFGECSSRNFFFISILNFLCLSFYISSFCFFTIFIKWRIIFCGFYFCKFVSVFVFFLCSVFISVTSRFQVTFNYFFTYYFTCCFIFSYINVCFLETSFFNYFLIEECSFFSFISFKVSYYWIISFTSPIYIFNMGKSVTF